MKKKKIHEGSKFSKLTYNLKNEIFQFLRFCFQMNELFRINKNFTFALNNKIIIKKIKSNQRDLLNMIDFSFDNKMRLAAFFSELKLSYDFLKDICFFLLKKKYNNQNYLYFSWNYKFDFVENITFLSGIISDNNSLLQIHLNDSRLGIYPQYMKVLSQALISNKTIKLLNLEYNDLGIDSENVIYIYDILKRNNTIESLFLTSNSLGKNSDNIKLISRGIIENKKLKNLKLNGNYLGLNIINIKYISCALEINSSIKEIDLSSNIIGDYKKNMDFIYEALIRNRSLEVLRMNSNSLGINSYNLKKLFEGLKYNKKVICVELFDNNLLYSEEVRDIIKEIKSLKNIINFHI